MERDLSAVGTIQGNRIHKKYFLKLSTDKELTKKGRGSFKLLVRQDEKMCVVTWMDNKSVLMPSTAVCSNPVDTIKRWSKKNKKYITISCKVTTSCFCAFIDMSITCLLYTSRCV